MVVAHAELKTAVADFPVVGVIGLVAGRGSHGHVKEQVFGVAHEVVERHVQVAFEQREVETYISLLVGLPLQIWVGDDEFGHTVGFDEVLGRGSQAVEMILGIGGTQLLDGTAGGNARIARAAPAQTEFYVADEVDGFHEGFFGNAP